MKNCLIATVLLLYCPFLVAQKSLFFFGEARDSTGAPLQFANIMAVDTVTNEMTGFAVSNTAGQFRIGLEANKVYRLKISFIGYAPYEKVIHPTTTNELPYVFVLSPGNTQLANLEVVAEMPVIIRGDTISYQAEAFTQGDERKLEDVLEDLPGFQVEENGEIRVQGKKVDKVLIDGKAFFDGDSKMATKNLPAKVIDRIQLLQNYNDIGPLGNLNSQDQLALNVELKEDQKQIVFGDLTLGGGLQERFYGHANTFYYADKTNLNLIADANNIGELAFTMQDYFRFAGGLGGLMDRKGSNFTLSTDNLGIPMAERNNAQSLDNKLSALNYNLTPSKAWQLSGFAIGSWVDNQFAAISNRTYIQENTTLNETFTSERYVSSNSGLGKVAVRFTPNYDLHLDYQLFGRAADTQNGANELSRTDQQLNDIRSTQRQQPWALEQRLSGYYALNEKDVLSVELNHKHEHQDPVYNLSTTLPPFTSVLPLADGDPFRVQQQQLTLTQKLELMANYYYVLNRTNHLNLSMGFSSTDQEYDAGVQQQTAEDLIPIASTIFYNETDFDLKDLFVGLLYRNKVGKVTWSPEVNFHRYQVGHRQSTAARSFERSLLLPGFSSKIELMSSKSINFNYRLNTSFMDVRRVSENLVISNYNLLAQGNALLENNRTHNFDISYRDFNMYNFLNIYGGLNYQRTLDDVQNRLELNGLERISIPYQVPGVNEQTYGYLNVEKRYDDFRVNLDGTITYSLVHSQLGELAITNANLTQRYKALMATRLWKKLSVRLFHEISMSRYNGNDNVSEFTNHETNMRINWKIVSGLKCVTTYSFNTYLNKNTHTSAAYDLLDMSVSYRKKGSPWEFFIEGMNLKDTRSIRRDSFSDNLISTYAYNIQQRYTVFKVMYDL